MSIILNLLAFRIYNFSYLNGVKMSNDHFDKSKIIEGRAWIIRKDNIDINQIYPERYLSIKDFNDIGQFTFQAFDDSEILLQQIMPGDILITGKNFGCGAFYQQAINCFISLGIQAIVAESFDEAYEYEAIKAGFPVLTYDKPESFILEHWDKIRVNYVKGTLVNLRNNRMITIRPFSEKQMKNYIGQD